MNLHPLLESAGQAEELIQRGHTVYQQFLCGHCGAKQTMSERNVFYTSGLCEECGKDTDIGQAGCNFMAVLHMPTTDKDGQA